MDIEIRADKYEEEQELIKLINLEEQHGVFEFEFKTEKDYFEKQRNHMEFDFDCIRVARVFKDGYKVDHPIRTEEEYHKFLLDDELQERLESFKAYPSSHFYDGYKYLDY